MQDGNNLNCSFCHLVRDDVRRLGNDEFPHIGIAGQTTHGRKGSQQIDCLEDAQNL